MNSPNPLMPQGSLPQFQSSGKSTVRIAVFTIIAIHAVFFSGLLMQGCNKRDATTAANKSLESTNASNDLPKLSNELYYTGAHELPSVPGTVASTEAPTQPATQQPVVSQPVVSQSQPTLPVINPPQLQGASNPTTAKPAPAATATDAKEYTIVRGDSFSKIAKANHVTIAALRKANPNVDPEKIQPGHKLQIPAAAPVSVDTAVEKVNETRSSTASNETNGSSHVVKPGDNLTKIAKQHRTTVSAIKALNPKLKTNRLLVGEKIKLPATVSVPSPLTSTQNLPASVGGTALR